jgi:cytochrome c553
MPESDHPSATHNRLRLARMVALAAFASLGAATSRSALSDDAKREAYGRHLARECTSCHRVDGVDHAIPSIVGWPPDTFVHTMQFYRDGTRSNPIMVSIASSLGDEQVQALAAFFASLPKPAKKDALPTDKKPKK